MNFLKRDLKEEARIQRRRRFEEERKKRIFDPKTRLFGVDVEAWQQQQLEKRKKEEQEEREQEIYTQRKLHEERLCLQLEKAVEKDKKELEKRIVEFRELYQKPCDRREHDLNDPDASKKAVYSENGVSRFDGEDKTFKQRTNLQKEQNRAWLLQQMEEKKRIIEEKQALEEQMTKKQMALNRRANELAELEELCRKRLEETTAEFNKLAAEEKAATAKEEAEKQARIEAQEVKNWVTGDFLTENPRVATSALGPWRVIPYMYKGEPPVKTLLTKAEQLQQAKENKIREQQEAANRKKWEDYEKSLNRQVANNLEQFMRNQKELDSRLFAMNSALADEQRRREAEKNDVRELRPTPAFFDQFNRSTY